MWYLVLYSTGETCTRSPTRCQTVTLPKIPSLNIFLFAFFQKYFKHILYRIENCARIYMTKRPHLRLTWLATPGLGQMWKIRPVKKWPKFLAPAGNQLCSHHCSTIPHPDAWPNSAKNKFKYLMKIRENGKIH